MPGGARAQGVFLQEAAMSEELETEEIFVKISSDADIVNARRKGRELAGKVGFSSTDLTLIATAISELARNIVVHAERGEIVMRLLERGGQRGIAIVAQDDGPGIPHVARVLENGFSSAGRMGLGLTGTRRIMDEFDIASEIGKGTKVTVKKWVW